MRNLMKICLLLAIGFILSACSTDPVTTNQGSEPSDYIEVYSNEGVQDSLPIGAILYDYLDLGILDFTNSDSIKISFDYVAHNALAHSFYAYYYTTGFTPIYLANLNVSGNQNTYKHVEFTSSSPNSSTMFYYVINRTNPGDSYFVTRNIKVSKK
jgi:hypothetical protein